MQIIGQENLISYIDNCVENNTLSKFIILCGDIGSGRKTIAKYIADKLNCEYVEFGNKIDDIRQMIDVCYSQTSPIVYCIPDAQDMSINAKNSILKICEEPPKFATIIMTTTGENTLATVKSRGTELYMYPYKKSELEQFLASNGIDTNKQEEILECANNIGQCSELLSLNVSEIIALCRNLVLNISKASVGNVLKITSKLSFKDGQDGINIRYFLNALQKELFDIGNRYKDTKYFDALLLVSKANSELRRKFNSQYVIDDLLINLKQVIG